jgi:hypothetical protein
MLCLAAVISAVYKAQQYNACGTATSATNQLICNHTIKMDLNGCVCDLCQSLLLVIFEATDDYVVATTMTRSRCHQFKPHWQRIFFPSRFHHQQQQLHHTDTQLHG